MSVDQRQHIADVARSLEVESKHPMRAIHGKQDISTRFRNIRANYATHQKWVDLGVSSWMDGDPYSVGYWPALFTPIESCAWRAIRRARIPLWPQFPAGRFFVDFGNPIVKVALECDGARWHDPQRDAERDSILASSGWRVVRVPGWKCINVPDPDDFESDVELDMAFIERSLNGVISELQRLFDVRSWMVEVTQ